MTHPVNSQFTLADYQKELDIRTNRALERLKKIAADLQKAVTDATSKIPDMSTYYDDAHIMHELLRGLDRNYEDYEYLYNLTVQKIMKAETTAQTYIKEFITQIQAADKLNRERLAKAGMTFPERKELDINAFYYIHLTDYTIEWTDAEGNECSISFGGRKNFSDMIRLNDYNITHRELLKPEEHRKYANNYNSWNPLEFSRNVWEKATSTTNYSS